MTIATETAYSKNMVIPKQHLTLHQKITWQKKIIRHDRWVIHTAKLHRKEVVKWHRAQLRWVQRELKQSYLVLRSYSRSLSSVTLYGVCISCWDNVASCESGGNWSEVTGNGFYWGLQWVPSTWDNAARAVGLPNFKWFIDHHTTPSREQQISAASKLSLSNWPVCGARY